MKAARNLAIACLLAIFANACHRAESRWGGESGSRAIHGDFTNMLYFEVQGDFYTGPWDPSKAHPLFVILWIGTGAGGSISTRNFDNRLTEINGHALTLSFTNRAVYALQQDYSVRDLHFDEPDLSNILDAISKSAPIDGDIWTNKLAPRLTIMQ